METLITEEKIDEKILKEIEDSIKARDEDIINFSRKLKQKLLEISTKENILERISKKLETKIIYFLRHCEGEHNKNKSNFLKDPDLTNYGKSQAKALVEEIKNKKVNFDLVFISPLQRTISTVLEIAGVFKKESTQFILSDLLREQLTIKMKNTGKDLISLKKYCSETEVNFNLDYIHKNNWWIDNDWNEYNFCEYHDNEDNTSFYTRIIIVLLWAIFKSEENILFVSHSKVFKYISRSKIKVSCILPIEKENIKQKVFKYFEDDILY